MCGIVNELMISILDVQDRLRLAFRIFVLDSIPHIKVMDGMRQNDEM